MYKMWTHVYTDYNDMKTGIGTQNLPAGLKMIIRMHWFAPSTVKKSKSVQVPQTYFDMM